MAIESQPGIALINPRVGQGKDNFQNTILPHLDRTGIRVDLIEPDDPLTEYIWNRGRKLYWNSARDEKDGARYDKMHASGSWIKDFATELGSFSMVRLAKKYNDILLPVHGLIAKNKERFVPEGDVSPEPGLAHPKTTAFVPLPETKNDLARFGKTGEVLVNGFLVPEEVKNTMRIEERKEAFANGKPPRIAYFTTGQFYEPHLEFLKKQILRDMRYDLALGELKLSVYLWQGRDEAMDITNEALSWGLDTRLDRYFVPDSPAAVQIYYNSDPDEATRMSFKIGEEADMYVTPIGERLPWAFSAPTFALEPVPANFKMRTNYEWGTKQGIIKPFGTEQFIKFIRRFNTQGGREYYERVNEVFCGGEMLNGAENIAKYMVDVVNSRVASGV